MNSVDRVKELCKNKKVAISRLEKDLGFGNGYISQLKKGTFPSDRLIAISNYLNVSPEYIVGETKEKSPAPEGVGLTETQQKAWNLIQQMDEESLKKFIVIAQTVKGDL